MDDGETEACGRCSMTTVVDAAGDDDRSYDPFDGARIEVDEAEMRTVAKPQVLAGRVKHRLDEWATRFVLGR
jgi:hypothetical protein